MEKPRKPRVEALVAVYKNRWSGFLAWAIRSTRNVADAEDLLHDVFLEALGKVDEVVQVENWGAWLFAALRNRVIDRWRVRQNRQRLGSSVIAEEAFSEIVDATGLSLLDEVIRGELKEALVEALVSLPWEQRQIIVLQVFEGLTFQEISVETGVSIETLASRKRYAIKKLGVALRGWITDP